MNIHISCSIPPPQKKKSRQVGDVENMVQPDRSQITSVWCMRLACNTAFPQQQWFRERLSMLRYTTYTACLVSVYFIFPYHCHSTNAPNPSSSSCYFYVQRSVHRVICANNNVTGWELAPIQSRSRQVAAVAYRGGGWGVQPPLEILKAL